MNQEWENVGAVIIGTRKPTGKYQNEPAFK